MKARIKKGFVLILVAALLVPNLGLLTQEQLLKNCENRTLSTFPSFVFSHEWSTRLENYYRDHFTFRNVATHLSSVLKRKIFKSSALPQKVCLGKEGWLYYTSEEDQMLGSYAHTNLWSQDKLEQKTSAWIKRKNKLEDNGISYHMAIWPNKTTIYPEYLSDRMKKQIQDNPSKTDQILEQLAATNSPIQILDLRADFLERKNKELLYYKHDSHWNELGAFHACTSLMNTIGVPPLSLVDYLISWEETSSGDLKHLMGLCNDDNLTEAVPRLSLKETSSSLARQKTSIEKTVYFKNPAALTDNSLVMFRDSYATAMIPFLGVYFRELYLITSDYNEKLALELDPDIVLVAKVERRL